MIIYELTVIDVLLIIGIIVVWLWGKKMDVELEEYYGEGWDDNWWD